MTTTNTPNNNTNTKTTTTWLKHHLKTIESASKYTLATVRFNDETYQEIQTFREKHRDKFGCIYGIPGINSKLNPEKPIYVLEMNNSQNRIMGIGCIQNRPIQSKVRLHKIGNYNRYIFAGKYRIDRTEMNEQEEQVMKTLDHLCFKNSTHLKRGQGLIRFPTKTIYKCDYIMKFNIIEYISEMFDERYSTPDKNT